VLCPPLFPSPPSKAAHPLNVRTESRALNHVVVASESGQKAVAVSLPEPCGFLPRGGERVPIIEESKPVESLELDPAHLFSKPDG
jgi:hypothetical protein